MNGWQKSFSLLLLAILTGFTAYSQIENAVKWNSYMEPRQNISVGDEITVYFEGDIDPGFHVYSAVPPKDWPNLSSFFELDEESAGIEIVGSMQEKGHPETTYDDVFETDITIFHDKITFSQKLKVTAANPNLAALLRFQVCDDSRCIPGVAEFSKKITTVEKKSEAVTPPVAIPPKVEEKKPAKSVVTTTPKAEKPKEKVIAADPVPAVGIPQTSGNNSGILNSVSWKQSLTPDSSPKVGDVLTLQLTAKVDPGYYVYSSIPPEKPAGLPTTFNLDETSRGIELIGELKEEGTSIKKYDEVFETDVQIYKDQVVFTQQIKVTEANPKLEGYLSYQVCDDHTCVIDKAEVAYDFGDSSSKAASGSSSDSKEESSGLWVLIIQAMALGFGSVLTPCVFPLIPLTVSFFTKQSDTRAKGIRNATFYGLSIIFIYTILGLLVSVLFGPDAMRQLSVSPGFNMALFALIFVFALSFLGMFDITLPSSWSTAMSKGSDRGGFIGIFLMAMTLAIVSFSCTGPLVFTALASAADDGEFIRPIIAMLSFSGALALPFVLFAVFPGFLNSLPKSGGWLNTVKVTLGFLELALAFIYLSRADLVLHWGMLDREIFIGSWIVIFGMLGIYLLGKLQLPHDSPLDRISVPRLLLAMGTFWFVLYLVPGLWGAPLNMLGGYIPESNNEMGVLLLDGQVTSSSNSSSSGANNICNYPDKISEHLSEGTPKGFCAFYDLEQGLEYAKLVNKPVFLDFTGHTCANCRYLEKNMWIDPQVRKMIQEEFVLISLYTDDRVKLPKTVVTPDGRKLRTVGDLWIEYERENYNQNAQPYYVLIDHDKSNLVPPTGYNPPLKVQEYRDFFKAGLAEYKKRH